MKEIELKILNIDRSVLEKKLIDLGAEKTFDGDLKMYFFDDSSESIRKNKQCLRLRRYGNKVFLAFKQSLSRDKVKMATEYETEVIDFNATKSLLESLGYSVWVHMQKHRTTYTLDGLSFEFDKHHDQYSYVPEFLEIEGPRKEKIYRYVKLLGYKESDCKPWTIMDVVKEYKDLP